MPKASVKVVSPEKSSDFEYLSVVTDITMQPYECPYCRVKSVKLLCFRAISLNARDFGLLLDRGWCRSGALVYLPDRKTTRCCPQISMRVNVSNFSFNRKSRSLLRKVHAQPSVCQIGSAFSRILKNFGLLTKEISHPYPSWFFRYENGTYRTEIVGKIMEIVYPDDILTPEPLTHLVFHLLYECGCQVVGKDSSGTIYGSTMVSENISCYCDCGVANVVKVLENIASDDGRASESYSPGCIKFSALQAWHESTKASDFSENFKTFSITEGVIYHKKGEYISGCKRFTEALDVSDAIDACFNSTLEACTFTEEKYQLYLQYQVGTHRDPIDGLSRKRFNDNLVSSPIISSEPGFGSFHRCYRSKINNQLIGMSLVDVLPSGFSSQYFVWDQNWKSLTLGVVSVLDEINLTQGLSLLYPGCHYYYMGIYVDSSSKMAYKKQFQPAELFYENTWTDMNTAIKLNNADDRREDDERIAIDPTVTIPSNMLICIGTSIVTFGELEKVLQFSSDEIHQLQWFVSDVGYLSDTFVYKLS